MKKNRMMRLASVLLICVLLTTSVISGTFAKYTSTASGSDTARVAKWSIAVNNEEIASTTPKTFTIDLFDTIADDTTPDGVDDANVADSKIIAPGTGGQFQLTYKNNSEVVAKLDIVPSIQNDNGIPIQFRSKVGDGEWGDWTSSLNPMETHPSEVSVGAESEPMTIQWKWAFEGGEEPYASWTDANDTALGILAQTAGSEPSVTVTITVTATQVD